eukprot:7739487-Pyramimonas_sp.AAC.1
MGANNAHRKKIVHASATQRGTNYVIRSPSRAGIDHMTEMPKRSAAGDRRRITLEESFKTCRAGPKKSPVNETQVSYVSSRTQRS